MLRRIWIPFSATLVHHIQNIIIARCTTSTGFSLTTPTTFTPAML